MTTASNRLKIGIDIFSINLNNSSVGKSGKRFRSIFLPFSNTENIEKKNDFNG